MKNCLHWFRNDLRLADNPGLACAAREGFVLPLYVLDQTISQHLAAGGASRVWLHHALEDLNASLGGNLVVVAGDPLEIIPELIRKHSINHVTWNRCYDAHSIARDTALKAKLKADGIEAKSFNGSLLWEPWAIQKPDGSPYKVFTPYYTRGCLNAAPPAPPTEPVTLQVLEANASNEPALKPKLLPEKDWAKDIMESWTPTEAGAHHLLRAFCEDGLASYQTQRDLPGIAGTSRLAPYLHFGQLSPNQVWHAVEDKVAAPFRRQLGWREFSTYILFHNPDLAQQNLNQSFDAFPWQARDALLEKWQRGQTGIPFVDAGMRELWQTGYMHNRVRMVVASFLVKNLGIHWHHGAAWFWDTLFDADHANNAASWQWVAGCGADAAPYFRIFSPVTQGQKFDKSGDYTRRFLPELAKLPDKYLFSPWDAPQEVLSTAKVTLGETYPLPVVDLKESRNWALAAYQQMKGISAQR